MCASNPESVMYLGNAQRPNYSNAYYMKWHTQLWNTQQQQIQQPQDQGNQSTSNMEEILKQLLASQTQLAADIKNSHAAQTSLKIQVGKIQQTLNTRPQGSLLADIKNLKQVMAITLRSETDVAELEKKQVLPLLFPQKHMKTKEDAIFKKFFDIFRGLQINLPLLDILQGMPKYAKYLRDVVDNKVKLQDVGVITLTEECRIVMTQKIPKKLRNPGKYTLPIQIRSKMVRALSDLGASINLMPLSLFETLGLEKTRSTIVVLQLADGSMV
ncbi:uncharacterized protein LOC107871770 [Capsicum annuum]|uniref:uncharacterized protein LOC107871770 n=1 Tax=Capsicum annuum TaxID=4072 RepID=UPI001FB0BD63|nr:uncharacterized protein LOC107871770 [Capsicum annuum]